MGYQWKGGDKMKKELENLNEEISLVEEHERELAESREANNKGADNKESDK